MRRSLLVVVALGLLALATSARATSPDVWGACDGRQELVKPATVAHCAHEVSYALYVDHVQWAAFGGDEATGIGTAYVNPCDVNCKYGNFVATGSASVTLSRPRPCGDRVLYTRGLIQLQDAYQGRTVYEDSYPCTQIVRHCAGSLRGGALRSIEQRAITCAQAKAIVRRWSRGSARVGVYRCRRAALGHHELQVSCTASRQRLVRFRAL